MDRKCKKMNKKRRFTRKNRASIKPKQGQLQQKEIAALEAHLRNMAPDAVQR